MQKLFMKILVKMMGEDIDLAALKTEVEAEARAGIIADLDVAAIKAEEIAKVSEDIHADWASREEPTEEEIAIVREWYEAKKAEGVA